METKAQHADAVNFGNPEDNGGGKETSRVGFKERKDGEERERKWQGVMEGTEAVMVMGQ